jgi:hypothetical protein
MTAATERRITMDEARRLLDGAGPDAPAADTSKSANGARETGCGPSSDSRPKRKPRIPEPPPRDISEIPDWLLGGG